MSIVRLLIVVSCVHVCPFYIRIYLYLFYLSICLYQSHITSQAVDIGIELKMHFRFIIIIRVIQIKHEVEEEEAMMNGVCIGCSTILWLPSQELHIK